MKKWLKLVGFIYLFIFAIELIKKTSLFLTPDIKDFLLQSLTPIKALSLGWFTTSLVQSSGAVSSITAAFAGNNLINLPTAVFVLLGAALGTTITALIISLITLAKQKKDFRHGFEIGLSYSIYSAILVTIVFILELLFGIFSKTSNFLAHKIVGNVPILKIPNIIDIITAPIINPLFEITNKAILLAIAFILLIIALRYLGKSIVEVFGGEERAQKFINKHFESKYKAYLTGVILTAIIFSSSITIGLLVPLAATRLIGLRKSIPFILGADLGTFSDTFLAALILGQHGAIATAIAYLLFALLGTLLFLPNTEFLHNLTKYTSKKLIKISREKALYILIAFIAIPLTILLLF